MAAAFPMAKQERVQKQHAIERKEDEPQAELAETRTVDAEAMKEEMDAILDDIDSVLEKNAQEFVDSYIQKGGE